MARYFRGRGTETVTGSLSVPVVLVLPQPPGAAEAPRQRPSESWTTATKPAVLRSGLLKVKAPLAFVRAEPTSESSKTRRRLGAVIVVSG